MFNKEAIFSPAAEFFTSKCVKKTYTGTIFQNHLALTGTQLEI